MLTNNAPLQRRDFRLRSMNTEETECGECYRNHPRSNASHFQPPQSQHFTNERDLSWQSCKIDDFATLDSIK
jgi:hypothetical protein